MECLVCEKETDNKRFCSLECCGKYKTIHSKDKKGICKSCNIPIKSIRKYCSDCFNSLERGDGKEIYKTIIPNCTGCDRVKTLDNTYQSNGKWARYCRDCNNAKTRRLSRKYKQKIVEYKGGCCEYCNNSEYFLMEFHHMDPSQKDFNVSEKRQIEIKDETKVELDKCVMLCANCHRREHFNLNSNLPSILGQYSGFETIPKFWDSLLEVPTNLNLSVDR